VVPQARVELATFRLGGVLWRARATLRPAKTKGSVGF